MSLAHYVLLKFWAGVSPADAPTPEPDVEPSRARPDDGGGKRTLKRRSIFKPTGLIDRPRTLDERVEDTAELAREVTERVAREFIEPPEPPPISEMTMAEVEREIGMLLRKKLRTEEDDLVLLLLMAAAAAG